ncbi:FapA family protein [Desulfoluna sp.]|uniref:FapA family protein n=1 Tax=Desulfoluna sp. TaxID=2045199 RepID=UPI0026319D19|nr:FapA family protein [Desulfoluna sp.]
MKFNDILCSQQHTEIESPQKKDVAPIKQIKRPLYKQLKSGVEFGQMMVKNRYISEAQLREALTRLKDELNAGKKASIDDILVIKEWVPQNVITMLRTIKGLTQRGATDKQFGEVAIELGLITGHDIKEAFRQQLHDVKNDQELRSLSEILVIKHGLAGSDTEKIHRLISERKSAPSAARKPIQKNGGESPEAAALPVQIEALRINVSEDGLSATLIVPDELLDTMTHRHLQTLAADAGIVFGLVDEAWFTALLQQPDTKSRAILVAQGQAPVSKEEATLEYHFKTDCLCAGQTLEEEHTDDEDLGTIPYVKTGTLLAKSTPSRLETPGTNVRGEPLVAPVTDRPPLAVGSGAFLSPDGQAVYAKIDGSPHAEWDSTISVVPEFLVEGDVGLRTGHIYFNGNIQITGTVQEGFHVQGIHVSARAIRGGQIEASAGLRVTEGIIDARIRTGGSLQAKYISNSRIDAFGDVVVLNEIMDSTLRLSGRCINRRGEIISSNIAALMGFFVRNVGTGMSSPCHLKIGVHNHVNAWLAELMDQLKTTEKSMDKENQALKRLEAKLTTLQGKTATLVNRQEQLLIVKTSRGIPEQLKAIETQIQVCFDRDDTLSDEITQIKGKLLSLEEAIEALQKKYNALSFWARNQKGKTQLQASGTLMEGTLLTGPHSKRVLLKNMIRPRLTEKTMENGEYDIA